MSCLQITRGWYTTPVPSVRDPYTDSCPVSGTRNYRSSYEGGPPVIQGQGTTRRPWEARVSHVLGGEDRFPEESTVFPTSCRSVTEDQGVWVTRGRTGSTTGSRTLPDSVLVGPRGPKYWGKKGGPSGADRGGVLHCDERVLKSHMDCTEGPEPLGVLHWIKHRIVSISPERADHLPFWLPHPPPTSPKRPCRRGSHPSWPIERPGMPSTVHRP